MDLFPLSPGFLRSLGRKSPQHLEKIARFPGGEKSAESVAVMAFSVLIRTFPIVVPSRSLRGALVDEKFAHQTLMIKATTREHLTSQQALEQNELHGPALEMIGSMTSLVHVFADTNKFSGSFPDGMADLLSLQWLRLSSNSFTGTAERLDYVPVLRSPCGRGSTNLVTNFVSAVRNILLVFVGSATSENKFVGAQNFTLYKVLESKCDQNNDTTHSGKCREPVFMHNLPFVTETF